MTDTRAPRAPLKFAKLFEIGGEQVLFFLDTDDDDAERLNQMVRIGGLVINMAAGGLTDKSADAALARIDEAYARQTLETARKLIGENHD